VPNDRKIFITVVFARATAVSIERNIQNPMETVFYSPVPLAHNYF
jgi:hypothetical protein